MSKVLEANCTAEGLVKSEGFEVPEAKNFGNGQAASEGILIIDGDKSTYLPKTISDLVTTLDKIALALDQIAQGLDTLDTVSVKSVTGPGVAFLTTPKATTGFVSQINSIKGEIDTLKGALK